MAEDTGKRLIQEAMASMNAKNQRKRDEELEAIVRKLLEANGLMVDYGYLSSEQEKIVDLASRIYRIEYASRLKHITGRVHELNLKLGDFDLMITGLPAISLSPGNYHFGTSSRWIRHSDIQTPVGVYIHENGGKYLPNQQDVMAYDGPLDFIKELRDFARHERISLRYKIGEECIIAKFDRYGVEELAGFKLDTNLTKEQWYTQ